MLLNLIQAFSCQQLHSSGSWKSECAGGASELPSSPVIFSQWQGRSQSFYPDKVFRIRTGWRADADQRGCVEYEYPLEESNLLREVRSFACSPAHSGGLKAEAVGVEPTRLSGSPVFKTGSVAGRIAPPEWSSGRRGTRTLKGCLHSLARFRNGCHQPVGSPPRAVAPLEGLEPSTSRLTAARSTD